MAPRESARTPMDPRPRPAPPDGGTTSSGGSGFPSPRWTGRRRPCPPPSEDGGAHEVPVGKAFHRSSEGTKNSGKALRQTRCAHVHDSIQNPAPHRFQKVSGNQSTTGNWGQQGIKAAPFGLPARTPAGAIVPAFCGGLWYSCRLIDRPGKGCRHPPRSKITIAAAPAER